MTRARRLVAVSVAFALSVTVAISIKAPWLAVDDAGSTLNVTASICMTGVDTYDSECLEENWLEAANSGELPLFTTDLDETVARHPGIDIACHDQAHAAGVSAYDSGTDPYTLITAGTSQAQSCDNGFVHGVIGAFARDRAQDEDLPKLASVCIGIPEPGRRSCVHGSGHAVWTVESDIIEATRACLAYRTTRDVGDCIAGVLMTILSPEHDPAEKALFSTVDEALAKYPGICASMYESGLVEPEVARCMFPLAEMVVNDEANKRGGVFNKPETADPIGPVLESSLEKCAGTGNRLERECGLAMYQAVFRHLVQQTQLDRVETAYLCDQPNSAKRVECLAMLDLAYASVRKTTAPTR
jgi:hypothetical protein